MSSEIPASPWLEEKECYEQIGQGFQVGLTIGSAYNFTKGFIFNNCSTSTSTSRFVSGLRCARVNCVRTCGLVGGLFLVSGVVGNAVMYYREKDGPFNTFACLASTAAVATARRGSLISSCSAIGFGTLGAIAHYYEDYQDELRNKQINPPSTPSPL